MRIIRYVSSAIYLARIILCALGGKPVLYISGKITDSNKRTERGNKSVFYRAERGLRDAIRGTKGAFVVNPCRLEGLCWSRSWRGYMAIDLFALSMCSYLVMLPSAAPEFGSRGAAVEIRFAKMKKIRLAALRFCEITGEVECIGIS